MRVAVITDIHANVRALDAVLTAVDAERPDAVWCLGDLVGYGPRPNECVRAVRERADVCLVGNHDLGVLDRIDLGDFTSDAAEAAYWTRGVLGDEERAFLESLEPKALLAEAALFHASARDPVWEYVLSEEAALASLHATTQPVVLVGHSHVALALVETDDGLLGGLAPGGTEVELDAGRWLLNPGSVGQPRDGDPRAAWLLLDFDGQTASFRRAEYDVAATQAEIREAGLPEALAGRLAAGA
jgi:diadenosine tetraphosphatase ApaH/serine/threonine PP2A family protein phosphatase